MLNTKYLKFEIYSGRNFEALDLPDQSPDMDAITKHIAFMGGLTLSQPFDAGPDCADRNLIDRGGGPPPAQDARPLFTQGDNMSDAPTLVRFYSGWETAGQGSDGLPLYKENIMHPVGSPALPVRDEGRRTGRFQRPSAAVRDCSRRNRRRARSDYTEGYPLALWPAVNEAEFKMLAARDIVTVEQLAKQSTRTMPSELKDLAERAQKLIKLQGGAAKYEDLLRERDGRIAALEEQVKDQAVTIATQKTTIDALRMKAAG